MESISPEPHLESDNDLDTAAVARVLGQLAERPSDVADVYFEHLEEIELPNHGESPGLRVRREGGLAVRLVRGGDTWLASRDRIDGESFGDAVRRVARALPSTPFPRPELGRFTWQAPPRAPEVLAFPSLVRRALRNLDVEAAAASRVRLRIRRHRRWLRIIGLQVASGLEKESFYSAVAEGAFGRCGALFIGLDETAAETLARRVARALSAADAPPAPAGTAACVLGSAASAVLLHEAVAHALEADVLARGGHPEAAIGVELGSSLINVFDDPTSAPLPVRRRADDEGYPTIRRCLLRAGTVEQPICDAVWARRSDLLLPGGGRRAYRHTPPGPRSLHLELAPGELSTQELLAGAEGGLFFPEAERGWLDPDSGHFTLRFPYGLRIENGAPASICGPCSIGAHVSELLSRVDGVGRDARQAGAGWCAKGGVRLAVWASAPDLRLDAVEIRP